MTTLGQLTDDKAREYDEHDISTTAQVTQITHMKPTRMGIFSGAPG